MIFSNKMKNKKNNNVGTVPKSNRKMVEIGKITTHDTQIHDYSLSWLGTGIPIKCGGVKLFLWAQTFPLCNVYNEI